MSDLLKRLKFDIYERVNLDDKNEDIKVIEETELTPQLKMLLSKDEVKLVGNLLLKIKYIGDIPFQTNEFEHNIPVEITIPSGRVVDAWRLDADIENFNIDLLGGRVVDVTGVMVVYEKESVKVDKVKLPKEVAEAIEFLQQSDVSEFGIIAFATFTNERISHLLNHKQAKAAEVIKRFTFNNMEDDDDEWKVSAIDGPIGADKLLKALVNGWEVEQTPEDKVRELYDNLQDGTEAFSPEMAVRETLDALNIKIPGVNT